MAIDLKKPDTKQNQQNTRKKKKNLQINKHLFNWDNVIKLCKFLWNKVLPELLRHVKTFLEIVKYGLEIKIKIKYAILFTVALSSVLLNMVFFNDRSAVTSVTNNINYTSNESSQEILTEILPEIRFMMETVVNATKNSTEEASSPDSLNPICPPPPLIPVASNDSEEKNSNLGKKKQNVIFVGC